MILHRLDPDTEESARRLGRPLIHDDKHGIWCLGPVGGGRILQEARMPPLILPNFQGNPFDLATLRGSKVLLLAWSSW